jgi:hypothetical protein
MMSTGTFELPDFSDEEKHIAEEVLTELVVLALTVRPALKNYIIDLCDGITITLPEDAVERSKQYALLRVQALKEQ